MATTELKVKIDAAINAEGTLKTLRELKKLQRETVAGSDDYKKIQARINDIGDAAKTAKGQSEDWIDALAGAGGPIGSLGRGLDTITSSTNKFGLALKATGIGLIVALVAQLVAAFTENEKAMKKLEPIMIAFEQILGGIFAALEPVLDAFVELAMQAIPYLTKGIGILYSTLYGLFTMIKDVGVGAGKLLVGIFTLDTDMISEGMDQITGSISNGVDEGMKAYERFEAGTKETTKTQKKNLQEAADAHAKYLAETKAMYEQQEKLRQADLDKAKAIAMSQAKTEEERLAIEKKFAEDSYNSKKKLLEQTQALYPKASKDYKDYTAQLISLEGEYINKKTEFKNKEKELAEKAFQDEVKAQQLASKQKLEELQNAYNLTRQLEGENAAKTREIQDKIFQEQQAALEAEKKLYASKKELSKEDKARIAEIEQSERNLTTTIQIENDKRADSDRDTASKRLEQAKSASDAEFNRQMQYYALDFDAQQQLINDKIAKDAEYYAAQEALFVGNEEKLAELRAKKLESDAANVDAEAALDQRRVASKMQALDAIISIAGAESNVGRAALIAKQILLAKELVMEAKKTITFSTLKASEATVATATGAAKTAAVGFPQNIPLLIAYAAQAAGIIAAIVSAVKGAKSAASSIGAGDMGGGTPAPDGGANVPKPRGLAGGGMVSGPGGGKSDLIPAMLSNGESVINANSTSMFRPLLSSINAIGGGKRFAEGGMALSNFTQAQSMGQLGDIMTMNSQPIKTYVVAQDMTNQQMMDREIKTRSTI
jgi:hypothetical protein